MKNEAGFSLIEVLFSLSFLSIVTAGLAPSFLFHLKTITDADHRTGAIQAAQVLMDEIRLIDPQDMPASGSDVAELVQVGSRQYSVVVSYCQDASLCTSINNRHITVEVSLNNEELYDVETVFTKLR